MFDFGTRNNAYLPGEHNLLKSRDRLLSKLILVVGLMHFECIAVAKTEVVVSSNGDRDQESLLQLTLRETEEASTYSGGISARVLTGSDSKCELYVQEGCRSARPGTTRYDEVKSELDVDRLCSCHWLDTGNRVKLDTLSSSAPLYTLS